MKKISIILITKNAGQTLEPCLEKLTQQTLKNTEILMLDCESTDDTISIAKKKLSQFSNSNIICRKKTSLAQLRMEAISIATGEYLLFVLPTDEINCYTCEILLDAIETNEADLVIGSFVHPYHKGYLPTSSYQTKKEHEKLSLRYKFLVMPFISGKLYKKELLKKIAIPDLLLHEELLNLMYLELSDKVITLNQILVQTKEHHEHFIYPNFWEEKKSFWFKTTSNLEEQELFYKNQKPEYILLSTIEHILFEFLAYKALGATFEELTMELYALMTSKEFIKVIQDIPHTGLSWKATSKEILLTNCISFVDFFIKQSEALAEISLFKLCILAFLKIYYQQSGPLNINEYLGILQENLNLNISEEAIHIHNFNF